MRGLHSTVASAQFLFVCALNLGLISGLASVTFLILATYNYSHSEH